MSMVFLQRKFHLMIHTQLLIEDIQKWILEEDPPAANRIAQEPKGQLAQQDTDELQVSGCLGPGLRQAGY